MKHCLLTLFLFCSLNTLAQGSLEGDRLALVALYNSAGGSGWYNNTGWIIPGSPGDNPCGWYGITCRGGRITEVNLPDVDMIGFIPAQIGNLTELTYLNFSGYGTTEFSQGLSGSLPVELFSLTKIEYLNLWGHFFNETNVELLGSLTKLRYLGITPFWNIPSSIGNLVNLENLDFSNGDAFAGSGSITIPASIGNLKKLKTLNMKAAGISGDIPTEIGDLANLELLDLTRNFSLTGELPAQLGNLNQLKSLAISNTQISGPIPVEIGNLTNLNKLNLEQNQLSGYIPIELGKLLNMEELSLGSNSLIGSIPIELRNLTKLKYGYLNFNFLSGTIPDLTGLPNRSLSIGSNRFTFNGIENNVSRLSFYNWQANINISASFTPELSTADVILSVDAGGTLGNNTYYWYKDGSIVAINNGDNKFITTGFGLYGVRVSNSQATGLTLIANNYNFTSLPVRLVSFLARNQNGLNILTWQTSSETNNSGFDIEKSADAKTFEKIGFVDGSGDSRENRIYHFTDLAPFTTTYYRLKQMDYDGKFEYSRIISVKNDYAGISIYPNPAGNQFFVKDLEKTEKAVIRNNTGQVVLEQNIFPGQSVNSNNLINGMYTTTVGGAIKKIVIQK